MVSQLSSLVILFSVLQLGGGIQLSSLEQLSRVHDPRHVIGAVKQESDFVEFGHTDAVAVSRGGCRSDKDCKHYSPVGMRCCPIQLPGKEVSSPGCPSNLSFVGDLEASAQKCFLPSRHFANSPAMCGCVMPSSCTEGSFTYPYRPMLPNSKQWLMIGDSVSEGIIRHIKQLGKDREANIQLQHSPLNALNSRFGLHCINEWLDDPTRWDLISFNFGIHDLSLNTERLAPHSYAKTMAKIAKHISRAAPQAKLLFATTTPVPYECGEALLPCNEDVELSGKRTNRSLLHRPEDPSVYNKAALKGLAASRLNISIVDLYEPVTSECGERFVTCPKHCQINSSDVEQDCIMHPGDVHFTDRGYVMLAGLYADAARRALEQDTVAVQAVAEDAEEDEEEEEEEEEEGDDADE